MMTGRAFFGEGAIVATLFACASACGSKPPPPPKTEPTVEAPPPPPPIPDASAPEPVEAAAPEPPPPGKQVSLCSLPTDATKAQCLTWKGCAGGIVETYAGKPIRKCAATADACADAESKLTSELEKLKAAGGGAERPCKLHMYLKKAITIDDARVLVCPEDADDRALNELWRQIAATCKEPISP
jgi:hypothetical protein